MTALFTRSRQIFGLLLLILPFVPLYQLSGESVDLKYAFSPYQWLLSIFIVAALSWLMAISLPSWCSLIAGGLLRLGRIAERFFIALCFSLSALAGWYCFAFKPHLIDVIVQLLQAKFFAAGMMAAPQPALEAFFVTQHMLMDGGQWYAQYAPIHSLLLALGAGVGAPWIMSTLAATLAGWLLIDATRRMYDQRHAEVVALLLLLSCFFIAMSASMMNHVTSFLWMSGALNLFVRWRSEPTAAKVFALGLVVGLGAATRSLEFVVVAPLAAVLMLPGLIARRNFGSVIAGLLGG